MIEHRPYPAIWRVPYQRNQFFTGREDVLSRLYVSLQADSAALLTQPQGLSGLGGIGKTQTAVEYAYRYRAEYEAVLWVRADAYSMLVAEFVSIAMVLQLPERTKQNQLLIVEAVKQWFSTHSGWLLIFDNVEDFAVANSFMPMTGNGHILVTTRARAMGGIAERLEIEKMLPEVGALLLLRRASFLPLTASLHEALADDRAISMQIAQELDGLPLALSQAGAYIKETPCTLSEYLDLYRMRSSDLLKERGSFDADYPESVATTWSLSFGKIIQANPAASELLHLFAFLYPDAIPEEVISEASVHLGTILEPAATNPLLLEGVFKELLRFSLLDRDPDTRTFTIHRLVQTVFKERMDTGVQLLWAIRTVQVMNDVFPGVEFETWPLCQRYLLHAGTCATLIDAWGLTFANAARLLNQTGAYLRIRARYAEAEPLYQRALVIWEQVLEPEHTNIAACLNNLAVLYEAWGKYEQAEPLYWRALAIWERTLGPQHTTTAICVNNLAQLYRHQGKYEQAEPLYQRSLEIREQRWGLQHPNTATGYQNMAELYLAQGKYEQARTFYQQALKIREQALSPLHPDIVASLNGLARVYTAEGKYKQAEPLLEHALQVCEQSLGPNHAETATCLNNLALSYADQGKYEQAEPLYQRALTIREQVLGPWHSDTAASLNNLAGLYSTQGKYEAAETHYQRAASIYEQAFGAQHPHTAAALNNLAELYRLQEKYTEAEPLYQRALAICEQALGAQHPQTISSLNNLALLYNGQGKYEQAESLYKKVLALREQVLGADHPNTAISLNNLAALYRLQGRYAQAEALYQRALAIWQQSVGSEHPNLANTLHNLALVYTDWGRYEQARELYQQALTIWQHKFGANHPRTTTILANYVRLLRKMGREDEAAALESEVSQEQKTTNEI